MHMLTLKYMVTVAEMGSFTRAAEKLYVSQPALSQSIQRLEAELQVHLFQKKNGRSVPTLAGQIVVEKGLKILELHRELLSEISNVNDLRAGILNIGASPFYQKVYLSRWLSAFQARYPGMEVTVLEGFTQNTVTDILRGELDLGLVSNPVPDNVEECMEAFNEEVLLAVPPSYPINAQYRADSGDYTEVDLSDFKEMNFISYRSGRNMTQLMWDECRQAGFMPQIVFKCGSTESVNAMIANGMGVGFVPDTLVNNCPTNQQAVYYRLRGHRIIRHFSFVRKKNSKSSPAQQCFLKLVKELSE